MTTTTKSNNKLTAGLSASGSEGSPSLKQWLEDGLAKTLSKTHPDLRQDEIYFCNGDKTCPNTIFKHERHHSLALDISGKVINSISGYRAIFVGREEYIKFVQSQIDRA